MNPDLEQRGINVIRALAMDAVQKANSGHPGTAMALAPLAHVLWTRIMKYDAADFDWPDRDRFVLSCGHVSILQYIMLFLSGTELTLDDLKSFRQWQSKTPGHPERMHVKGVDTTTGPLGQGFANAVGMALAERSVRTRHSADVMNHYVFGICSDGDMQEGVSHEAASIAGMQKLGRLIFVYDDNHITIDGDTSLAFCDDTAARFRAYGWDVDEIGEVANDLDALEAALRRAMAVEDKPSLIILRSHIGYPSPNFTDTSAAHGSPLGEDEVRLTKSIMGMNPDEHFAVPDDVLAMYREAGARHATASQAWRAQNGAIDLSGTGKPQWFRDLPTWSSGDQLATREALAKCLDATHQQLPGIVSGAADLTGNTGVAIKGAAAISAEHPEAEQMYWGVREHAMASAMVGAAMHGGTLPIGGTFFVFSDYQRPALRLAVMNNARVIFVWSHDSIGVGEDGPTHQPIEHLASLRAIPGFRTIRPADANETAHALRLAVESDGPTGLVLTRQKLPVLPGTADAYADMAKGAYVVHDASANPDVVVIATGSEVAPSLEAAKLLDAAGISARVVSMPSWELFADAGENYHQQVLGKGVPRLSVEAATSFGWSRWADAHISIDHFGASAPASELFKHFGFTPEHIAEQAQALIARKGR